MRLSNKSATKAGKRKREAPSEPEAVAEEEESEADEDDEAEEEAEAEAGAPKKRKKPVKIGMPDFGVFLPIFIGLKRELVPAGCWMTYFLTTLFMRSFS